MQNIAFKERFVLYRRIIDPSTAPNGFAQDDTLKKRFKHL